MNRYATNGNPFLPPVLQMPWDVVGHLNNGAVVYIGRPRTPPPAWPMCDQALAEIGVDPDFARDLLGIPPGFPLWYTSPRPALPVGPVGRAMQQIQDILDDPVFREVLGDSIA